MSGDSGDEPREDLADVPADPSSIARSAPANDGPANPAFPALPPDADSTAVFPDSSAVARPEPAKDGTAPTLAGLPPGEDSTDTPAASSVARFDPAADEAVSALAAHSPDEDSAAVPTDSSSVARSLPTTDGPASALAAQPNPWPGLPWGFIGFFTGYGGFYLVSLIVTGVAAAVAINPDAVQANLRGPAVLFALLPNLFLGIGPAVLSWWRGHGPRLDFGIRFRWSDVRTGFTCGVVAVFVGLAINLLLEEAVFHQPQQGVAQQLGQLSGGRTIWLGFALLYTVVVAPVNEEMLMRGALWGALEHYRVPKLMILGATALVFALLHQEPTLTLALFAQGIAIGVARMRTGGIGASMVAHATNNLLPAVVLWFASKS